MGMGMGRGGMSGGSDTRRVADGARLRSAPSGLKSKRLPATVGRALSEQIQAFCRTSQNLTPRPLSLHGGGRRTGKMRRFEVSDYEREKSEKS